MSELANTLPPSAPEGGGIIPAADNMPPLVVPVPENTIGEENEVDIRYGGISVVQESNGEGGDGSPSGPPQPKMRKTKDTSGQESSDSSGGEAGGTQSATREMTSDTSNDDPDYVADQRWSYGLSKFQNHWKIGRFRNFDRAFHANRNSSFSFDPRSKSYL